MKIETEFREDPDARTKSYYAKNEDLGVTLELIEQLVVGSHGQNARLCLHRGSDDGFHQMLILEYRGKAFPAHRHPTKSEGYHIIFGEMVLLLYDTFGNVTNRLKLDGQNPIARVGPNTFHSLEIITPYVVYHETKPGPFVRESDKVIPIWAQR